MCMSVFLAIVQQFEMMASKKPPEPTSEKNRIEDGGKLNVAYGKMEQI